MVMILDFSLTFFTSALRIIRSWDHECSNSDESDDLKRPTNNTELIIGSLNRTSKPWRLKGLKLFVRVPWVWSLWSLNQVIFRACRACWPRRWSCSRRWLGVACWHCRTRIPRWVSACCELSHHLLGSSKSVPIESFISSLLSSFRYSAMSLFTVLSKSRVVGLNSYYIMLYILLIKWLLRFDGWHSHATYFMRGCWVFAVYFDCFCTAHGRVVICVGGAFCISLRCVNCASNPYYKLHTPLYSAVYSFSFFFYIAKPLCS